MSTTVEPGNLGRLEPPDWKHVSKFPHDRAPLGAIPAVVETTLKLPDALRAKYNQGNSSMCVGFSACIQMSVYEGGKEFFDAPKLYHAAQAIDGIQGPHEGTYVRSGFDILRTRGPQEIHPQAGIDTSDEVTANFWCASMDDVRAAHGAGRIVVWGINWYSNFDRPTRKNGEWWVGLSADLGHVRGGHAIAALRWSDKRQAYQWTNSWGLGFPRVWCPAAVGARLLSEQGEVGYGVAKAP